MILPSYDKMMIQDEESGENVLKYPKTPEGQAQKIQDAMAEIMRIVQRRWRSSRLQVEEWAIKVENS